MRFTFAIAAAALTVILLGGCATEQEVTDLKQTVRSLQTTVDLNQVPLGTIVPWYSKDPPPGKPIWARCDGTDLPNCPDLSDQFLRGASPKHPLFSPPAGSETANVSQHGSNNSRPDGNGWHKGDGNYLSNDVITINTVPPFTTVLYLRKIANK